MLFGLYIRPVTVEETWDTGLSFPFKVKNSDLGEVHPVEPGNSFFPLSLPSSVCMPRFLTTQKPNIGETFGLAKRREEGARVQQTVSTSIFQSYLCRSHCCRPPTDSSVLRLLNSSFPCLASAGRASAQKPATSHQSHWLRSCCNNCVGCVHCDCSSGKKNCSEQHPLSFPATVLVSWCYCWSAIAVTFILLTYEELVQHCIPTAVCLRTSWATVTLLHLPLGLENIYLLSGHNSIHKSPSSHQQNQSSGMLKEGERLEEIGTFLWNKAKPPNSSHNSPQDAQVILSQHETGVHWR